MALLLIHPIAIRTAMALRAFFSALPLQAFIGNAGVGNTLLESNPGLPQPQSTSKPGLDQKLRDTWSGPESSDPTRLDRRWSTKDGHDNANSESSFSLTPCTGRSRYPG
jgi:hypothetical protein